MTESRIRRRDIFSTFERVQDCFTDTQWEVVTRYYRDGKSEQQIADELGLSRSAVNERRHRAEERKRLREAELREEQFRLLRKYQNP
ncbi:MAG: sigma factor-like helix-turn-helix DNA-binding protein [Phycisphaerales bacterium JB039]